MKQTQKTTSILDVCGRRTLEYIPDCLARFNRGAETVRLRTFGGSLAKGVRVAQILADEFDTLQVGAITMVPVDFNGVKDTMLEIPVTHRPQPSSDASRDAPQDLRSMLSDHHGFVSFPIYHVLLDALLAREGEFSIHCGKGTKFYKTPLLRLSAPGGDMTCRPAQEIVENKELLKELTAAYYRGGLLLPGDWKKIAEKLSRYDDVVIGVDTNILRDAGLSEHLISSLSMFNAMPHLHTPNWMLIVIPSAVMHEIEQAGNSREDGFLTPEGRQGFRALQEILELGSSADLNGISVVIHGGANPALDTTAELRQLKVGLARLLEQSSMNSQQISSLFASHQSSSDTIIRDQFKNFLRQVDFFKGGVFFVTADKTNSALAHAEGLFSIYYKAPSWFMARDIVKAPRIPCVCNSEVGMVTMPVPLGKLIYELAVQFRTIRVSWHDNPGGVEISCDAKGEFLEHWIFKDLIIREEHLQPLLDAYQRVGKFSLLHMKNVWEELCQSLTIAKFI